MRIRNLLLATAIIGHNCLSGQNADSLKQNKSNRCLMMGGFAGLAQPSGKLSLDYGSFGEAGGSIHYLNRKRILFGMEGGFLFGGGVKKDPVPNLRNPDGTITGSDGSDAVFKVFQRGSIVPAIRLGYLFGQGWLMKKGNRLGGFSITVGMAWLRHYTYIQDLSKKTPQFSEQYRVGYDRLATGPATGIWLGYLYLSDKNLTNLQFELGYLAGFTRTARYNFADETPAGQERRDNLFQLRLKWYFTVRSRAEDTSYFY